MAEFLRDPSSLTKDMLKRALVANNVALPRGDQRKEVYVELYLRNLTTQYRNRGSAQAFSSDEEPSASTTVRAGRKATRKTDRVRPVEIDMSILTDDELKERLLKYGVIAGPIVESTRKLYEKKLQKFLDRGPPQATTTISTSESLQTTISTSESLQTTNSSRNGNSDSDQYSDKEEETSAVSEPDLELEPEPVPVVERPLWSRGKTQVTTRTRSSQHKLRESAVLCNASAEEVPLSLLDTALLQIEKLSAVEQNPKTSERDLLKELFPHENFNMPTGISATCRQPIKGAAGRPFSNTWHESLHPRLTEHRYTTSSYTEGRFTHRPAAPPSTHLSAPKHAAPPSVQTKSRRRVPVWVQLLLFAAIAGFLLFIYQAMENNQTSPFGRPNPRDGLETAPK